MRTKNTLKTFIYSFTLTGIIALLGLVKTKILLAYLGQEYVGVYQLFYQLYIYISLVDGGIGASVTYHLYKPIHEKKENEINNIYNGARYYYNIIGLIVILLGITLSFGIMFLIKETTIAAWYIRICFILFVISSATSYFSIAHSLVYEAEQKLYKPTSLQLLLSISESIVSIIVALLGGKLLIMISIFLLLSIIKNAILIIISKKEHKYLKKSKQKNLKFRKDSNSLIISKINTLINENIDIVIISKFVGLEKVVIYAAYNQIVNMLNLMIQRLHSSLLPSIGNLLVANKEKAKATFIELNSILFYIGSILFVPLYYMLTPFIRLWYGKEYMVSDIVTLLFVMVLYINIIKISLESYVKAAGEFKSVKNSSIYQSVMNIILSLILVQKYGIGGVLIATVFAFITGNFIHYPRIISKKIINDKTINYYKKCLKYVIGLIINIVICYYINSLLYNVNLFRWLINGIIIFTINLILTSIYYWLTKETKFIDRIKFMIKKYKESKAT